MARITLTKGKNGSIKIKATGLKSPSLAHALKTIQTATAPILPLMEPPKQQEAKKP